MQCYTKTALILTVFLTLTIIVNNAHAISYHFAIPMTVSDGLTVHFSDGWVNTSGTDIHLSVWGSWVNYTVDGAGTQQVHKGSLPSRVYIDDAQKAVGNGWIYSGGTVTLTGVSESAELYWNPPAPSTLRALAAAPPYATLAYGIGFNLDFRPLESLCFQHFPEDNVSVTVRSGMWNASASKLYMHDGGGAITFEAFDDVVLQIDFTVTSVKVEGDRGNSMRPVSSGSSVSVESGNIVTIIWEITLELLLPMSFIIGMVGLAGMFGGPLYAVHQIKQNKYRDGFVNGVIWTSIGAAFVLAWLW